MENVRKNIFSIFMTKHNKIKHYPKQSGTTVYGKILKRIRHRCPELLRQILRGGTEHCKKQFFFVKKVKNTGCSTPIRIRSFFITFTIMKTF